MRRLVIATTIVALSFGSVALAQSARDSRHDEPVTNSASRAPEARPAHRAVAHAPAHNVRAVKHKPAPRKPAHVARRYSAVHQSRADDFSADQLNHQELLRHSDNRDDSRR